MARALWRRSGRGEVASLIGTLWRRQGTNLDRARRGPGCRDREPGGSPLSDRLLGPAAARMAGRAAKLCLVLFHILLGCAVTALLYRGTGRNWGARRRRVFGWWHARLCQILDLSIRVSGRPALGRVLMAANHVSWMDIPVLAGLCPTGFVAKREVRAWPVIGWLSQRVGTRFIERGHRRGAAAALADMSADLRIGLTMTFFPEGTTRDGTELGCYHPLLFQAGVDANVPLQPVVIFYADSRGRHLPEAAFLGDDSFVTHLWRMLSLRGTRVYVHFDSTVECAGRGRRELAEITRSMAARRLSGFAGERPRQSGRDSSRAALAGEESAGRSVYHGRRIHPGEAAMSEEKIVKPDEQWRNELSPEQYEVCRRKGTERPFTGKWYASKERGMYVCACCGNPLFSADAKFDSGTGWPSFWQPRESDAVRTELDTTHGMRRVEVMCARCDAHLGHVFEDGPLPTGLRYCINSVSLDLDKEP